MVTELEALAARVADGGAPRDARVSALRELVSHTDRERSLACLRAALADRGCAELLPMMVRSLGYYPGAVADLEPFLDHADAEVSRSAVRGLAAIDPATAVRLTVTQLKRTRSRTGAQLARALAERCPGDALPAFRELAFASRARQRMVALVFLRKLDAPTSLPILLEMFRRETKPAVRKLVLSLIARRAKDGGQAAVQHLATDLTARAAELAQVLTGRTDIPEDLADSLDDESAPVSQELRIPEEFRAPPPSPSPSSSSLSPSPPPAPPLPPAPPPATLPSAKLSRPVPLPSQPTPTPPPGPPAWAPLAAAAAVLALVGAFIVSAGQSRWDAVAPPVAAPAVLKLGKVGGPVDLVGEVVSFDAARGLLRVRTRDDVSAEVRLPAGSNATFVPGQKVSAMGVIRYLGPGTQMRVQAFRVKAVEGS